MHKVRRLKNPTKQILAKIAQNLQEKFKSGGKVSMEVNTYNSRRDVEYAFWLHPGDGRCFSIDSWDDLLDKYFELMEEGTNDS